MGVQAQRGWAEPDRGGQVQQQPGFVLHNLQVVHAQAPGRPREQVVKSAEELHPQQPPSLPCFQDPPSAPNPALCTAVPHSLAWYLHAQVWEPGHREPALPPMEGAAQHPKASTHRDRDWAPELPPTPHGPGRAPGAGSGRTDALCPPGAGRMGAPPSAALPSSPPHPGRLLPLPQRVPGLYKESFVWAANNCSPLCGNMGCVS